MRTRSLVAVACFLLTCGQGTSVPGRQILPCHATGKDQGSCAAASEHVLLQRPRLAVSKVLGQAAGPAGPQPTDQPTVVSKYGHLKVEGSAIVSSLTGEPVHLHGMSLFWSHWMAKFWNEGTVRWLKKDWGVTLVRAAMAVEHGGYLENPKAERARLVTIVDAAIDEGLYVIIDWHDHHADEHLEESKAFFRDMALKYGKQPNVLFEVFNEPIKQSWSGTIKPYHEEVVRAIREHSDNLIILGTRKWSQEVDVASLDPVAGENLAYTVHFYANTHRHELRQKVTAALANGVAIFATEWGTCDASGDGTLDLKETESWLEFLGKHNISDANWAIGDKREACSALKPGASAAGGWAACDLTASGAFVRARLRKEPPPPSSAAEERCPWAPKPPGPHCAATGNDCTKQACCQDENLVCYQKNEYWSSCRPTCNPGIDPTDPPQHQTPWTCKLLK